VDLEDLGVLEGMDMGVRLHDRISLFGDANGRARGGTNVRSLLGTGAHFQYDAGMGGLLKILRHEKTGTQVAARLGLGFYGGQEVGIGAFASSLARTVRGAINEVRREVESKQIPTVEEVTPKLTAAAAMIRQLFANADDLLLTPFSGRQTSLQLTAAQALSRHVGLQAYAGWRWATLTAKATRFRGTSPILSIDLDQSISAPEGGVAADFDGASLGIPLDLILEYAVAYPTTQTTSQTSSGEAERKDSRFEQSLASGLYYSGRPNLQLGVHAHATFEKQPVSTLLPSTTEAQSANDVLASEALSGPPSEMGGQFVFRYIW
jgi:hypothetical protein